MIIPFCFCKRDVGGSAGGRWEARQKPLKPSALSGEIPSYSRLSLTNATQVRLFNAASVRSEAFSQDEWDDWLSLGTNSRKLRFIVARRCLLPRYDTYGSLLLIPPTLPLPRSPRLHGSLQWDTNDNYTWYVTVALRRERGGDLKCLDTRKLQASRASVCRCQRVELRKTTQNRVLMSRKLAYREVPRSNSPKRAAEVEIDIKWELEEKLWRAEGERPILLLFLSLAAIARRNHLTGGHEGLNIADITHIYTLYKRVAKRGLPSRLSATAGLSPRGRTREPWLFIFISMHRKSWQPSCLHTSAEAAAHFPSPRELTSALHLQRP